MADWDSPGDPWASERLIYRAVDDPMFEGFFRAAHTDGEMTGLFDGSLNKPRDKKRLDNGVDYMTQRALAGMIICLKPSNYGTSFSERFDKDKKYEETEKLVPIGTISLEQHSAQQHRTGSIGIGLVQGYRSKGYGSEAIRFMLEYAFSEANLHTVEIGCFGFNTPAIKCYEKLGFTLEGRKRQVIWRHGKWWDEVIFGMLEDEWKEIKAKREQFKQEEKK